MNAFLGKLFQFPKTSFLISLLVTGILSSGVFSLKGNFNTKFWFHSDDPQLELLEKYEKKFGGDDYFILLIQSSQNLISKQSLSYLKGLSNELREVQGVGDVISLHQASLIHSQDDEINIEPLVDLVANRELEKVRAQVLHDKTMTGHMISKDQKTSIMLIKLHAFFEKSPNYIQISKDIDTVVNKYQGKENHSLLLSGQLALQESFRKISSKDLKIIGPLSALVILIFLYFSFRSVLVSLLPILLCAQVIFATLGLAGLLGISYNNLISLLPGIVLAICCADTIHIVKSYQNKFFGHKRGMFLALRENIVPTFLTSLTTSIGFLSFVSSKVRPIYTLGLLVAFGVMFAWLVCTLSAPLFLRYIGDNPKGQSMNSKLTLLVEGILKRRKLVVLVFSIVTTFCLFVSMNIQIDSEPFKFFKKSSPIFQANQKLRAAFNGNRGPIVVLRNKDIKEPDFLAKVEGFEKDLNKLYLVSNVNSILDTIRKLNQVFHNDDQKYFALPKDKKLLSQLLLMYEFSDDSLADLRRKVDFTHSTMTMSLTWKVHSSAEAQLGVSQINELLQKHQLDGEVNGKIPLFSKLNDYVAETIVISVFSTAVVIALILFGLFRNLRVSLISIIPNIVPIFIGAGVAQIFQIQIDVGTALVASVCMGIAVDDTIHFLYHYLENIKLNDSAPLRTTFVQTAPALCWTTLVLVLGFSCFLFGDFVPNQNFGLLCGVVLSTALLTDLTLLPALLSRKKTS